MKQRSFLLRSLMTCVLIVGIGRSMSSQILIALVFGDKLNTDKLEFGLNVAPCLSRISNMENDLRFGLNLGLYFNVKLGNGLYLHPEANPKTIFGGRNMPVYLSGNTNIDALFAGGHVERKIQAVSVPLLLRYYINEGLFFVEAGPQIDLMLRSKDVFSNKVDGNDLEYTIPVTDQINRFDFGMDAGIGMRFRKSKSMAISLRYFWGMTDLVRSLGGGQSNQMLTCNIYIPIGGSKAAAVAAAPPPDK